MSKKYGQPEYEVPDNKTERGRNMQRGQGYGMNSIFHRISVRKYQNRDVEQEKIELMLKAAMAAPSACNQQPWEFYVVKDKAVIERLSEASPYAGRMKAVREVLDIPEDLHAFALIPCGYPAEERAQEDRYEESRVHYIRN